MVTGLLRDETHAQLFSVEGLACCQCRSEGASEGGRMVRFRELVRMKQDHPVPLSPRVLLVDDESDVILTVGKRLEHAGFQVLLAADGEQALAKVWAEHPDLVILDLKMPKLDGAKVSTKIRQNKRTRDLPIIILTGKGEARDQQRCRVAGADSYLIKSEGVDELIEEVRYLLHEPSDTQ